MKKIISIVLSALIIIGCVAISATANTNVYTVDDVASIDSYVAGYWNVTTGVFTEHTHRIATNGYVAVDSAKTYTITSGAKSHGSTSFYLAEFDADKNFVAGIGRTELGKAGTYSYAPSSANVAYVALTATISKVTEDLVPYTTSGGKEGLIQRWKKGTFQITMVADGESGGVEPEPESSTVTTTTTTTTTSTPVDTEREYTIDDVASINSYVPGYWSEKTGAFAENAYRIATNGLVAVDSTKTYTLTGNGHSNLQFYLAEFDADKNFVAGIGMTTIGNGTCAYAPSNASVAYIALSVTIQNDAVPAVSNSSKTGLIERWTKGSICITMTADVEETTTTTTTVPAEKDGLTTDIVSTVDGAAIRLNEVNGMRFTANFKGNLDEVDEIGIIIAPKDIVGEYITMEDNVAKIPYDTQYALWEGNQFVGSIVELKDANLARDFIARAYVVIDDVTYYANQTAVRNIAAIADEYMADANGGFDKLDTDTQALVEKWAKAND